MTSQTPEGERPWTAAEVDAFTERTVAEVNAIQAESPGAARALLAERALAMVTKLTQGAEDSLHLEQQLRDQGAPAADIEKVRRLRDRIMTSAGGILATALENTDGAAPGAG